MSLLCSKFAYYNFQKLAIPIFLKSSPIVPLYFYWVSKNINNVQNAYKTISKLSCNLLPILLMINVIIHYAHEGPIIIELCILTKVDFYYSPNYTSTLGSSLTSS